MEVMCNDGGKPREVVRKDGELVGWFSEQGKLGKVVNMTLSAEGNNMSGLSVIE